ncbi:MAG TPA: HEAT repeat domain-containing protein [Planctomycetota bacterium]|jgi:hypothetical protein|nr:HEAT repeat domain-containing protein [Planctomycetota bacterium]
MRHPPFLLLLLPLALAGCRLGPYSEFVGPDARLEKRIQQKVLALRYARGGELLDTIGWLQRCGEPAYPGLLDALSEGQPSVRAAAALVLGATGDRRLVPYLKPHREDGDLNVRYEVARALARLGDWSSLETLIAGLRDGSPYVRALCHETLCQVTRLDFGYAPLGPDAERAPAVERWESWWERRRSDPFFGG